VLRPIADVQPLLEARGRHIADDPVDRPSRQPISLGEPGEQLRQNPAPEIRPHPGGAAAHHDAVDHSRDGRRHERRLAFVAAVEHRCRLLFEIGVGPVVDVPGVDRRDLAIGVLAGDPERVIGRQLAVLRIELADDRIPAALRAIMPVHPGELFEIVFQPQPQPALARVAVAGQHESR